MSASDKAVRLQLRQLALQLRELTGHVASLARMVGAEASEDVRLISSKQIEQELFDLTASIDGLLDSLPPEMRSEGNGG